MGHVPNIFSEWEEETKNILHRMKKQYSELQLHTTCQTEQIQYTCCWGGIGMECRGSVDYF
jgi:hypothetical protein